MAKVLLPSCKTVWGLAIEKRSGTPPPYILASWSVGVPESKAGGEPLMLARATSFPLI